MDTPWPMSSSSRSTPRSSDWAPVETMIDWARNVGSGAAGSPTQMLNGRWDRSTRLTRSVRNSAPNRAAWFRKFSMSSGPMMPSGNPG